MKIFGFVPARMAASRFPGKPLHSILGRPMIEHCFERAKLFDHWELHKKNYGYRCAYTGNILTHIRLMERGNKIIKILSNISIDRLHPGIGYTETNTFFVCGDINSKKNNLSPKECLKIVNFCKERGRYDLL